MKDFTFTIIKPEIVRKGLHAELLDKIIRAGFRISAMKLYWISADEAKKFYDIHRERPFYNELVEYISSSPVIVAVIKKENAVNDFRLLIGNTDPVNAEAGTIRKLYGTNISENAIHGSDSDENAQIESQFFFSGLERF